MGAARGKAERRGRKRFSAPRRLLCNATRESMTGEYRGGEALTPSVIESKRKLCTAEKHYAERSKKTRGRTSVNRKKMQKRILGKWGKWGKRVLYNLFQLIEK